MVKDLPAVWETLGQEDPLEKGMQPTAVFLPGEFLEQRSLVSYRPWGCKESDTTEEPTPLLLLTHLLLSPGGRNGIVSAILQAKYLDLNPSLSFEQDT